MNLTREGPGTAPSLGSTSSGFSLGILDLRLCFLTIILAYGIYRYLRRLNEFRV